MSRRRTYQNLPPYCTRSSCAAISVAGLRPMKSRTVRHIIENVCPNCAYNATNKHDGRTMDQSNLITEVSEKTS